MNKTRFKSQYLAAMLKSIFNVAGVAAFAAAMFALPAWSQDGTDGVEDGYYKIHSPEGNYLSYSGAFPNTSQENWGNIWYIKNLEGGGISIYIGKTKATALELSSNAAEIIRLYASTDGRANQKWLILPNDDGSSRIRTSLNNGRVITDNGTEQLAALTYDNNLNTQKWLFERISDEEAAKHFDTYEIDKVEDGYYKIHSPDGNYLSYSGISPNTFREDQKDWGNIWYVKNLADGGISIRVGRAKATALELISVNQEGIQFYASNDDRINQKWFILPNYDRSSRIRTSRGSGDRVITDNGTEQLTVLTYDNLNTQKWLFERISDEEAAKHFDIYEIDGVEDGYYKIHSLGGNYLSHSGASPSTLQEDLKDGDNIWYVKNLADGGISISIGSSKMTMLELISYATEGTMFNANYDGINQKWFILPNYDRSSRIRTSRNSGVITDNGTEQLTVLAYDNLNTQKWVFERISDDEATKHFDIYEINGEIHKIKKSIVNTEYNIVTSVDGGSGYLRYWSAHPFIMTYVGNDGLISVCSVDTASKTTYIYEYSSDLQLIKTLHFDNEYDKIGSFAKDDEGNYYIFYARYAEESERDTETMAVAKYNSEGTKIKVYKLKATDNDLPGGSARGVVQPFRSGTSRMEISGNMLAVYFARSTFTGHQGSCGFVLDKNSLERMPVNTGWQSHSFNQYILPIENGFIFADQYEGGTGGTDPEHRRFVFNRMQVGVGNKLFKLSFVFKMGPTPVNTNQTYAQMGGLAKTSSGYIFAGTYEKNTIVSDPNHSDSRNLFISTFDNDLTFDSEPLWITNYDDIDKNAANPKIVSLGGHFLLMWEYMASRVHLGTYMQIIDENGNPVSEEIKISKNVRLNINDVLRYNKATGNVHWAVNDGSKEIIVYSLNVQNWATPPSSSSTDPSSSSTDPSSSSAGEISSSSEDSTPIANYAPPAIASETSTYYNIKGEPMGRTKPAKPGVYLVKQGSSIHKIVVSQ